MDDHGTDEMGSPSTLSPRERESVTLSVTVDVSDMAPSDREAFQHLARLYESAFEEVVSKNRDYSWSFLRTGAKLAHSDATPFSDPARSQAYGLLTRVGDKHERLVENVYGQGDAAVSAPASETALEAANYYVFLAFVLANPDLANELGTS